MLSGHYKDKLTIHLVMERSRWWGGGGGGVWAVLDQDLGMGELLTLTLFMTKNS